MASRTILVTLACLAGLVSCTLSRGPVAYEVPEASSDDGVTWWLSVPSCNGDPVLSELIQGEDEVGVEVTTTTGSGLDCADEISFTLDEPLGDRTMRDLVSGNAFIVCGTVAPGQLAGGDDVRCR